MRLARVIFRHEGDHLPPPDRERSVMFQVDADLPNTAQDCRRYEPAIRLWFDRTHPGDAVAEIWFSRPEILYWPPERSRCGQDAVVEGGLSLSGGQAYRLVLEVHAEFCNCAWCRFEDCVAGEAEWISASDIAHLVPAAP